jgi:hypothetical protein
MEILIATRRALTQQQQPGVITGNGSTYFGMERSEQAFSAVLNSGAVEDSVSARLAQLCCRAGPMNAERGIGVAVVVSGSSEAEMTIGLGKCTVVAQAGADAASDRAVTPQIARDRGHVDTGGKRGVGPHTLLPPVGSDDVESGVGPARIV